MPIFRVTMGGNLLRPWPSGEEIQMFSCVFTKGNGPRDFEVRAEITSSTEEEAQRLGREQCSDAADLLEFCLEEPVNLNLNEISIKPQDVPYATGFSDMRMNLSAVSAIPLSEEQLSAVRLAEDKFQSNGSIEREILTKVVHWHASGRREVRDRIDRFIKLWISLEVLVNGKGKQVKAKIENQLAPVYDKTARNKLGELAGRLYGFRGKLVHKGIRHPEELRERLAELEDILDDLLRARLGLRFKGMVGKRLT
jgi:hypothetical protein